MFRTPLEIPPVNRSPVVTIMRPTCGGSSVALSVRFSIRYLVRLGGSHA